MRFIYLLGLSVTLARVATAQTLPTYPYKTIQYIGPDGRELPGAEGAHHRIERTYRDSLTGSERVYGAVGKLQEMTMYADLMHRIKLGPQISFYENGQVRTKEDYVGNKLSGEFLVYYASGKLKRRETYLNDVRTTGECLAEDGSVVPFYVYYVLPTYKGGGTDKIVKAIASNIRYPAEALRNNIQGRVFVAFRVKADGEVDEVKVVKGVFGLDGAALEAVKKLKGMTPGLRDGEPVDVSFTMPVTFSIAPTAPGFRSSSQRTSFPNSTNPY